MADPNTVTTAATTFDPKQVFTQEMQKLTIDGLKNMGSWIEGAKDFALEQAPLFAQEYTRWYAVSNIKDAALLIALIIVFIWVTAKSVKIITIWKNKERGCYSDVDSMGTMANVVLSVICFIACSCMFGSACDHIANATKTYVAPRVVIVEGIKDILNDNNGNNSCRKK